MYLVRFLRRRRLELEAACVAGAVATICLLRHGSVPSFRHDWQWPTLGGTFAAVAHLKLDAWWWQGFGSPSIAAQLHPLFVIPSVAAGFLSPYAILVLLCIIIWSASSGGMVALLRDRFGASQPGALSGAIAYAFAPLIVVKTVAGHLAFLVAYAFVPLAVWSAMAVEVSATAVLGAALAVASVQLQVFGLAIALVVIFRRLPVRFVALAITAAICSAMPHLWGLLRPGASVVTLGMVTSHPWELALSSPMIPALVGLGYFAPYWQQATASPLFLDHLLPATYAIGLVWGAFALPANIKYRLIAIYVVGVLLVSGLYGPLSPVLWLTFSEVPAFSALRELYDMSLLIVFSGSCAYAMFVSRLAPRTACFVTVSTCVIAMLPWADGLVLAQTSAATSTTGLTSKLDRVSRVAPWSRLLILPPVNPSGPIDDSGAGADPLALPYRSLLPLWVYLPTGFQPEYLWLLARRSRTIDRNFGISAILARTHFTLKELGQKLPTSTSPKYPKLSLVPLATRGETINKDIVFYPVDESAQLIQLIPSRFPSIGVSTIKIESEHGANPNLTSAPIIDYWYASEKLAEGAPSGSFTVAKDSTIRVACVPTGRQVWIALLGKGFLDGRRVDDPSWQRAPARCGQLVDLKPRQLLAVTVSADIDNWTSIEKVMEAPRLRLKRPLLSDDTITVTVQRCKRCSLMLMEGFDPGWKMAGPHSSQIEPSDVGGFNEWNLDVSKEREVRIYYEPAQSFLVATGISIVAWSLIWVALFIAGAMVIVPRR